MIKIKTVKKTDKRQKLAQRVWTAAKVLGAAVLVGGMMSAKSPAQVKDTVFVKPHLSAKTLLRAYDGGEKTGIGLGLDAGLDIGKVKTGGSITIAKGSEEPSLKIEETYLWVEVPATGRLTAMLYAYTGEYEKVPLDKPTFGIILSGGGLKIGAEKGVGFWDGFVKVPFKGFAPTVALVGWDGKVQKLLLRVTGTIPAGSFMLTSDVKAGKLFTKGGWSLDAKLTIAYTIL